ncbi:MAG: YicC/YloC family endoribonuclease [Candidatus Mucispirillum faecigallinarum]|nr:YicC/YloC family endoribonuclease [Candidatus Mucispirillum faecigallinarum]
MIKSMTGFGKINKSTEKYEISVEIKSVNSKYFDINFRLPKVVSALEITLRQPLQDILIRGKVDVRIEINIHTVTKQPSLNIELVKTYRDIFTIIADTANIEDKPKLDHFLRMPDVVDYINDDSMEEELEKATFEAVMECAKKLDIMRQNEGAALDKDINKRLDNLAENIKIIENAKEDIFEMWKAKFIKRMQDMGVDAGYEERIVQEASIMGEKADITEEITRLQSHIVQFKNIITNEYPVGKKLDFLSQEIHRELNTIASKSSKQEIIATVVESKAESDRIREQVQNII